VAPEVPGRLLARDERILAHHDRIAHLWGATLPLLEAPAPLPVIPESRPTAGE
jgi:hypothetical protein